MSERKKHRSPRLGFAKNKNSGVQPDPGFEIEMTEEEVSRQSALSLHWRFGRPDSSCEPRDTGSDQTDVDENELPESEREPMARMTMRPLITRNQKRLMKRKSDGFRRPVAAAPCGSSAAAICSRILLQGYRGSINCRLAPIPFECPSKASR